MQMEGHLKTKLKKIIFFFFSLKFIRWGNRQCQHYGEAWIQGRMFSGHLDQWNLWFTGPETNSQT